MSLLSKVNQLSMNVEIMWLKNYEINLKLKLNKIQIIPIYTVDSLVQVFSDQ